MFFMKLLFYFINGFFLIFLILFAGEEGFKILEGTVSVISSDPPCKDCNA